MPYLQKEYKNFLYLCILLGLITIVLIVLKLVLPSSNLALLTPSQFANQPPVSLINWNLVRKPLTVHLPSLNVALSASPATTTSDSGVDLIAQITSLIEGPFVYKFDCQNDNNWELVSEPTSQKIYTAPKLCSFNQEGAYQAVVQVQTDIEYFANNQTVREQKKAQALAKIAVQNANTPPQFLFCDVNVTEGTNQNNFKFFFTAQAQDEQGDEIQYEWDLGDGSKIAGQNIEYTYKQTGNFFPKVKAVDSKGGTAFCFPRSLNTLARFSQWQLASPLTSIGRKNPFSPYTANEKGLLSLQASTTETTSQNPSSLSSTSTVHISAAATSSANVSATTTNTTKEKEKR